MINPLDNMNLEKRNFVSHSKYIKDDDIFISLNNGIKYLSQDDINKLSLILIDSKFAEYDNPKILKINNLEENYLKWIDEIYDIQQASFKNFFVTGTNGKSTTIDLLSQAFSFNSISNSTIGTLGTYLNGNKYFSNSLTTEEPLFIRSVMRKCLENNIKNIFIEASSIGLHQNRLKGLTIEHAALTNISRDHLDYHKSFDEYLVSKLKLAENSTLKTLSYNLDEEHFSNIKTTFVGERIYSVSNKQKKADIYFEIKEFKTNGRINFSAKTPWGEFNSCPQLHAKYNIYNLLLSLPYYYSITSNCTEFFSAAEEMTLPSGRLQKIPNENIFIDFAHTPDALDAVCSELKKKNYKGLKLVFGAGGGRDQGKRELMGNVAQKYAKKIYITSDNPRFEKPEEIINMIAGGISDKEKVVIEQDRAEAINMAINELKKDEILLITGKGHEEYQIIGDEKKAFSDYEEILKCIK
ncbi:MAG: UDP-N-acetylmuramoyl-L-alanyl-D-glutamate--2,6-diaminopimelate ligase [Amoebophilaceae bacterium TMED152]|nr:hypothetical protein [Gammaproteobacteria bacterium]RPH02061.1 MAG: UDP-N-acetylmuramoyl-L-alanyl-D-glutamate--2,6-diaminopimelate ligase [Amoebophilaceae bacterium TMED152]|tara:strand:+ start:2526 stop:3926 length:1401 start_codon:yes stop_codon:yes gene_type:complete